MNHVLVTGAAGFIGFHFTKRLLAEGYKVTGLDNLNDYYDVRIKENRLKILKETTPGCERFHFVKMNLEDREGLPTLFSSAKFNRVVHLAAQAGVRYSLENPFAYLSANMDGTLNVLECCRHHPVEHLVYASTSSVYGANTKTPFATHDKTDRPISLYAATKKANELMAYTYAHLFGVRSTGLRFFTVYGPWGRPDMALFKFTKGILSGKPIDVYNHGDMERDFTYVDDIVEGVFRVMNRAPEAQRNAGNAASGDTLARIYNIGNGSPVRLMDFVHAIEEKLGRKAEIHYMPMQPGDVPSTCADVEDLYRDIDFRPHTHVREGISRFIDWYREYYGV